MKDTPSFNLLLANFFIGLMRGHRFLHPASDEMRRLGYVLFRMEPSFVAAGGRVNPDAMACSQKTGHTLLAEWTGLDAPDSSKKEQIRRYLSVKREDLVDRAAVRTSAASANSTLLVVRPSAVGSFRAVCGQTQGGRLMLSSFACPPESGYRLEYQDGDLSDAGLARLLKGEVTANRVPRGYVRVLTHDLSVGSMAEVVIQQLVSFAAKKRFDFTLEDFCSQVFSVWRLFDVAKRRSIAKAVARVLSQLVRKRYAQRWIEKTKEMPPAWRFKINEPRDSGAFFAHMRGIAARFLAEVGGKPIQGELFDSIEDQPMAGAPPE